MELIRTHLRHLARRFASPRGNVALLTALLIPAMTGATGVGVEVGYWSLRQVELQRTADAAALSATLAANGGATAQTAAGVGADIAEMNGLTGATTRSWDSTSNTLTDNQITVKKVSGIKATANTAFQVVLKQSVPLVITKLVTTLDTVPIAATGYAEIVPSNVQGCIIALGTGSEALHLDNNAAITTTKCATKVNGNLILDNNSSLITGGVSVAGTITSSNGSVITGTKQSGAGTTTDPYGTDTNISTAFATVNALSGASALSVAKNTTTTINPGNYSSISIASGATVTMSAGTYYVKGSVSLDNNAVVTGSGVTIVTAGQITFNNNSSLSITAPTKNAVSGIPGIAIAGNSKEDWSLSNNTSLISTGVIYYPNGHIEANNNFGQSSTACSIIIANSMHLDNNASFANNCTSDSGVKNLPVSIGNPTVTLVK